MGIDGFDVVPGPVVPDELDSGVKKVRDEFADLATQVIDMSNPNAEVSFEPYRGIGLTNGIEPTRVVLRGSIDLTSQFVESLPKILKIDGSVIVNPEIINRIYNDQSYRSWDINGPIKILGTKGLTDAQREELKDKLETSSAVGTDGDIEFA